MHRQEGSHMDFSGWKDFPFHETGSCCSGAPAHQQELSPRLAGMFVFWTLETLAAWWNYVVYIQCRQ